MQKGKGKDKKGRKAEKPKVRDLARAGGKALTDEEVAAASGGTASSVLQANPLAGQSPCGGPRCKMLANIQRQTIGRYATQLSVQP
jgi:hypothetical protein